MQYYSLVIHKSDFVYQFQFLYDFFGKSFMEKSKICDERELQNYDADWYTSGSNSNVICETSIKGCGVSKKWSRLFEGRKGRSCNNPHKDNSITDFYDDWSIERTCDSATLESNHPRTGGTFLYTHECQDDEIAYFKIDFNFIGDSPDNLIGLF